MWAALDLGWTRWGRCGESGPPSQPDGGRAEGGAGPHGETDPRRGRRSTA